MGTVRKSGSGTSPRVSNLIHTIGMTAIKVHVSMVSVVHGGGWITTLTNTAAASDEGPS